MPELELDSEQLFVEEYQEEVETEEGTETEDNVETEDEQSEDEAEASDVEGEESEDSEADSGDDNAEEKPTDVFEVNGKEYTPASLSEYIAELESGSLRQSDYTKKTQELAGRRKALDSDVSFVKMLKENDLIGTIKDVLIEAKVDGAEKLVDAVVSGNAGEHPDSIELSELRQRLDDIEAEKEAESKLSEMVDELAKSKGITREEALKVRKFAEDLYNEKGTALQLEDAFDLYSVRQGKVVVKRKQPSAPKTPSAKRGAKPPKVDDHMDADKLFI